jgi:hypothetical protein
MASMKPDPDERTDVCLLISASCTTGWFDWIHGELWLCPDGLLRRSLGLLATIRHSNRRSVDPTNRPMRSFRHGEIVQILATSRRNRWITWGEISHAILKRGVLDHSLHLDLLSGGREKFLWLRVDGGYDVVEETLMRSIGGRFEARDVAIG